MDSWKAEGVIEPLTEDAFIRMLRTDAFGRQSYFLGRIDSTNAFAKRMAAKGVPHGTLVIAEEQTGGRGRWGRAWQSPPGMGLWFSLVLRPSFPLSLLTLLGAVSIAEALENSFNIRPSLQWPNDVVFDERKAAGILAETVRNGDGTPFAVLGVGLNVHQREADFPPDFRGKAVSLAMLVPGAIDRVKLLADVLRQMERDYAEAEASGCQSLLERWACRSNLVGKKIALKVHEGIERGRVAGFHANGDIILFSEDGKNRRFSDGHVLEVRHAAGD
jgi:BirA family biotin operon repressor/biotin-[acetyl-CoA-carboxylase] ligase